MTTLVRYSPNVETVEPDEAETIAGLEEQLRKILDTTSEDYGHAVRSVHAKGHGLAKGTLTVLDGLAPELAQGLFATPGEHEAIMRFSTNAGDILDDAIKLPRGVALKIFGVEGDRLPGSEGDATQDFVLVNAPAFAAPNTKMFLTNLKMLAATTDKAEGAKKMLSSVLRAFEAGIEAVGGKSPMLSTLGGAKPVHPLGAIYFSQTAFRYGDYIAKFQLLPVGPNAEYATALVSAADNPDAIREHVDELLREKGAEWELRVQLCTDLEKMPIEDASVVWDESLSSFRTVAKLSVPPQPGWVYNQSEQVEDRLAFSPWHGLAAHHPLGNVNRARTSPYEMSANYRARFNGCPIHEPRTLSDLEVPTEA